MRIDLISIFPSYFDVLKLGLFGKAMEKGVENLKEQAEETAEEVKEKVKSLTKKKKEN